MEAQAYRARRPKLSPLWQCLDAHFDTFLDIYPQAYERDYGFLRPIIPEVVGKFMGCGDFAKGFARVRCDHCAHEYLLAFSCKGRWFCPSCHQKKVQLFGALLAETILAPVPHRHFTFTIPKMLRPYFRFHRGLIKELCRIAHRCLAEFQRTTLGLPEGTTGVVIPTSSGYLRRIPRLPPAPPRVGRRRALRGQRTFSRDARREPRPAEELFRARVITFLVKKGLLPPERARMLRGWRHSGFNIHRSQRVPPDNREDMERLAQYIIRNPFSVEKMQPNRSGDSIIYRSGMNPKIQRNFEVFSPCDFIARITQHIPDKSFQLVRYYGWYSNKMRGLRLKQADPEAVAVAEGDVIDVSAFKPRRIPSKKWRELIKKVWEADPLLCPHCQHEMRIIALIDEAGVIERILRHLGLWEAGVRVDAARDPPEPVGPVIEPWLDDPFPNYDHEPVFAEN